MTAIHRRSFVFTLVLALCATLCATRAAHAGPNYWKLSTGHITVVSNGSATRAAKLAGQFLSFERLLGGLANLDPDSPLPQLMVFSISEADADHVFLTDADRKRQRDQNMHIYSKYLPGQDSNVAAVVDAGSLDDALDSVMLLYGQSFLSYGPARSLPPWYQVGVPNITNGVVIHDDGSIVLSRNGQFEPDVAKGASVKYDLATLLATTGRDLNNGGDVRAYFSRAHDWAQFGLLTGEKHKAAYRELAVAIRQGTPVADAVQSAFGMPLADLAKEFDGGKWRKDAEYRMPAPAVKPALPDAVMLDAAQAKEQLQIVTDRVASGH